VGSVEFGLGFGCDSGGFVKGIVLLLLLLW